MSRPDFRPWLPLSIHFLVPEIDAAAGPHGAICEWWPYCYLSSVEVGGREVPFQTYVTTCTLELAHDYPPAWPDVPPSWKEPGCPVRGPEPAPCLMPCPVDCTPPRPDMTGWRELVPAVWDYPELNASAANTLAASDDDGLWWY